MEVPQLRRIAARRSILEQDRARGVGTVRGERDVRQLRGQLLDVEVLRFRPWIRLRSRISTLFGTYGNSDSGSGSRKKWIRNSYRGVMILSPDLDPELDS